MDDRRANIDLVFRNGLKDYEVLPPAEAWNHIRPVIRRKQRPVIILRAAAAAAVLLSLSFLANRWSMEISSGTGNNVVAEIPEFETANTISTPDELLPAGAVTARRVPLIAEASLPDLRSDINIIPDENLNTIQNIVFQSETERISVNRRGSRDQDLVVLNKPNVNALSFEDPETLYSPTILVKGEPNKWSISALVSPTYYTNFYSGKDEFASEVMSEEKPVISYSGGVAFSYKINKRLSIQSGLYYSSFGQELSGITSFGGFKQYDYTKGDHNFEVITANGVVYTSNADVYLLDNISNNRITTRYTNDVFDPAKANLQFLDNSLRQNFSYLELPVVLRYKIVDKTVDLNIIGGLSSNVLVRNSVYAALDGSKYQIGKTEGLNLITFSSSLGMGMEYNFTDNLSVNLEPTFRYYLNPFNEISRLKLHPYSFGIFSGLSFRF
jgi:hypothetical protein